MTTPPPPVLEVRKIEDPQDRLLVRFYREVLGTCFPLDELRGFTSFQDGLTSKEMDIGVAVIGRRLLGGVVGEWHEPTKVYLGSYVAVKTSARNAGVAGALIGWTQQMWRARGAELVLAEVEDPRFYLGSKKAYGDAKKRLKLYRDLHARMLDLRYTLPKLEPKHVRAPNLRLITFPVNPMWQDDRISVDAVLLREWLKAYVKSCRGEPSAAKRVLLELIPELASDRPIPLLPLPEYELM